MSDGAAAIWITWFSTHGDAWWILAVLALATFASDDLACIAGGVLVGMNQAQFVPVTIACFTGMVAGDLLLVAAGRSLGRAAMGRRPFFTRVNPQQLERAEHLFARHGPAALLASRFLPGTRLPLSLTAGILRLRSRTVLSCFCISALAWTPLLVGFGAWFGGHASATGTSIHQIGLGMGALLAGGWLLIQGVPALSSYRGRRLLLSRWRRLTRWEYWPAWAVYPPVVAWALLLGLRHRSLLVCTAANPGIGAAGGLCGESKAAILTGLADAGNRVARWTLLEPGTHEERLRQLLEFQSTLETPWPLVLKPDVGERGSGVVVARDQSHVERALAEQPQRLLAQAYVGGVEFGVFYLRPPGAEGRIFSITEKRTVAVIGDDRSSIEQLILADDRAVGMAAHFLRIFSARLSEVPEVGQIVVLAELGTHCRGALFLDGERRRTPELESAIDRVSRSFEGFHFGRYDVRSPSPEAFERGEFTVIELNGLTSEATNIYDPTHSLWFGWRTLCQQWTWAYAIGAANAARGARIWSLREVWSLLFQRS